MKIISNELRDILTGECKAGTIRFSVEKCGGVWTTFRRLPGDEDCDVKSFPHASRAAAVASAREWLQRAATGNW